MLSHGDFRLTGPSAKAAKPVSAKRPGFRAGFGAVFSGFGFILRTPRVWPYALVPPAILFVLASLLLWLAFGWVHPHVSQWLGEPASWYGKLGSEIFALAVTLATGLLGLVLAMALTPPLSGPALEQIVTAQENAIAAPPRVPIGFLGEMWCGLRAQLISAAFALPLIFALWVLDLFVPPAVVITTPLNLVIAALALAWNLLDYPLTLRGVRIRERLRFMRVHKRATLGFGAAFALLFWIPCFNVMLLPVGVAAATRLVWRLLEHDPASLPSLGRAAPSDGAST
jgi:CysZ protein